jgi:hypothetical protein
MKPFTRPVVVLVALVAVVAGTATGVLWWIDQQSHPQHNQTPPPAFNDGPTFYSALAQVNSSVQDSAGGPWLLFSAIGLAAQSTIMPAARGISPNNLSVQYCGAQFNGLTVWNGTTFPVFNGSIASGTAPFWQFAFFSNESQMILVATDINFVPTIFPPIPVTNPCATYGFGGSATASFYVSWLNPIPIDTNIQAANAALILGNSFERANYPILEMFNLGYTPFDGTNHGGNGVGLAVEYSRCGMIGAAGFQPEGDVGEDANGTVTNYGTGSLSCTVVNGASVGSYLFAFGSNGTSVPVEPGSSGLLLPFQVEYQSCTGPNNNSACKDGYGMVSWMTSLTLEAPGSHSLPAAPPSCQSWVPSLSRCGANSSGWSVVLVTANGAWADFFPGTNRSGWAIPNALVVSQEAFVLLTPSSWNLAGDSLAIEGSSKVPAVAGIVGV